MKSAIRKTLINKILIIAFLLAIFFSPIFMNGKIKADFLCIVSFAVNGFLFMVGIYRAINKYSISMKLIYWLFMFFFMYFAPMVQYQMNSYPWRGAITEMEILLSNAIILIFNIFFIIGCYCESHFRIKGLSKNDIMPWLSTGFELKKNYRIIFSIVIYLLTAYSVYKTGWKGIVVSRTQATNAFYTGQNSAIELIVESVIPAFFTYVVTDAAQNTIKNKKNIFSFLLLFTCLLLCFFPTTIPRFKTATIYGVIALVLFPWINKGSRFFWLFTVGIFVIFPMLSAFRYDISHNSFYEFLNAGFFSPYTEGDYDAYRMLVSAIRYVNRYGSTWGYQLLGVIFFFIPSAIWKTKPIGSGGMLIKSELGKNVFSNVSCPYIAEGLVNFGILGVVLFALFLGTFIQYFDKKYWKQIQDGKLIASPYLYLVFMMFFVLRGDLLSGYAYLCGFVVTGFLLKPFTRKT